MGTSKHPLRINVGFLINQPVGTNRIFSFDAERFQADAGPNFEHFSGTARVNRVVQGILIQGDFQAEVLADCVRCLEAFLQPLRAEFDELYAFKEEDADESGQV